MQANSSTQTSSLNTAILNGETFYQISNVDKMRPFFMSIVSDSNHWMFIGSNGGLSAGRKDSENALFPYYTDDKIIESAETTGSKSIFQVSVNGEIQIWEPFSERFSYKYKISRNLYKNVFGNKILFEEINHDLKLVFRYEWNSSNIYGFVKKGTLINQNENPIDITFIDGIQNILPYNVGSQLQNQRSNLVDAYKRNELKTDVGIGIFALSAIIVDKAEPSEALKANIAWSLGIEKPTHLLSSLQLDQFRAGLEIKEEVDIKAEKGAFFISSKLSLNTNEEKNWSIITNINQNHSSIALLAKNIKENASLASEVDDNIELGTKKLVTLNASADGLQLTADKLRDTRHFANSLFNIMRGGIFDDNYNIDKKDFSEYVANINKNVSKECYDTISSLSNPFTLSDLKALAFDSENADFTRICLEYLPLKFSRRHGDPSRPWNQFSINTHNPDGSKILDYEGNWRDIFQNWEALGHSFPEFMDSMICKFLNASTFDGYNPYRVTKNGIDWETIEPDDPWSYIGYWGDHQIIYLLKFLEFAEVHNPGGLANYFEKDIFVYANVPYKIKSYKDILKNPKDTIDFDANLDHEIHNKRSSIGADSVLLLNSQGKIHHVNFTEKILATVLSKLSNFIPEGGIWMNTQRPEWNDANNALVGNGVSMVTLCYLRRFLDFFEDVFANSTILNIELSEELLIFYQKINDVLKENVSLLNNNLTDVGRRKILDDLGIAGSDFRNKVYSSSFSGIKKTIAVHELKEFSGLAKRYLDHSIAHNKREDELYHAYNLMTLKGDEKVSISYLSEMLEGQVAVLSSGYLSSAEAVSVLNALKASQLFRPDQYSYLLYPNKDLAGFLDKNVVSKDSVKESQLLTTMVDKGDGAVILKDINGNFHFNDNFKNSDDLSMALKHAASNGYQDLVDKESEIILNIFEDVFNHKAFTGRSGTFFGYEGLGSIYWHMVSKLQVAVQECCIKAFNEKESEAVIGKLLEHYYEINQSIGIHKSPSLYGAFPTDPYSHTPAGKGAQQPGMTGQVKEDILCRFGELGIFVINGKLTFNPCLLRKTEFLKVPDSLEYVDVQSNWKTLALAEKSLCFSYCQTPIIYKLNTQNSVTIFNQKGESQTSENLSLDEETSKKIFARSGEISRIEVNLVESLLR